MNFNDYKWHDAVIKNINIDRTNPGLNDTIIFDIVWSDEIEKTTFIFEEVYWANFKLNFGVVSDETILNSFELSNDNQDLVNFYSNWQGAMNEVKLNDAVNAVR